MELFASEKINDYLTRIRMPGGVFTYLAEGKEKAALIDTGCGYGHFRSYVESITDKPYIVILTHGHVDHAGGAGEFPHAFMNPLDLDVAAVHTQKAMRAGYLASDQSSKPDVSNIDEAIMADPMPLNDYIPMADGKEFELGGLVIKALSLPGHTPGCMCILFRRAEEEKGLLLAGDAVNSLTLLCVTEGTDGKPVPLSRYKNDVAAFYAKYGRSFDDVIYSHPHNKGGRQVFPEMVSLCQEILHGDVKGLPMPPMEEGQEGRIIAKEIGRDLLRKDGHYANLVYQQNEVC